ncbi:60S ribosomal protein L7 [Euphorbia peplus]|nr:60S ribosomal protein L7 [Euphorbia peplus]
MGEVEAKALTYLPEVVLKKRKHKEESIALTRKTHLEFGNNNKKKTAHDIKRPQHFIKDFRDQLRIGPHTSEAENKETKVSLISTKVKSSFHHSHTGATAGVLEMLQKVEPYVTFGYPNPKNVDELIRKKGYGKLNNETVPLVDNNIIEQALGKYGILCLEDIIHQISTVGPHFKEITSFLGPFALSRAKGAFQGKKALFKDGGDTGNREDKINDLVDKMN